MWKVLVLILFFPASVCAFWPLSWEFDNEQRFLGPLVSYERAEENTGLTLRPLLFSYDSRNGGEYNYLYPLGKGTREKSFFVPFYYAKSSGENEWDSTFLFFFCGRSEKQGGYAGLFPFYGVMYDRFGADELGFFMWPLYSYKKAEGAEKYNVLFPFFAAYTGAEKGFKAWPLYGTRERAGEKRTSFFMWPVFIHQQRDLDTDDPTDAFYVAPFYMGARSRARSSYSILWPVYSYQKDAGKERHGFFLNLFSKTKGEDVEGYSFFPFVSLEKKEQDTTLSILWPLYRETDYYVDDERFLNRRILLFNRYVEEKGRTFLSVWPFFEVRREKEDTFVFAPTVLPFRDAVYDRIVRPLTTLYEQRTGPDRRAVSVFYGLITNERKGEDWKTRFAFLFEVKKEEGRFGFEILSGLFGIDKRRLKVLFIPIPRG